MAGKYDKNIKITVDDKGALKQKTQDINNLNNAVDRNNKKSGNLDRNMKGNARMSSNASKNFSKQAQGMQGVLVPAYAEVAARVFALTAAYTALKNAADYSTLLKGQEAYARMTGKHMGSIARDIQSASGYMLDFQQASTSAALASTAGLTTKQIASMTKGARAASVALGRDMADAMDRLTRGIVKAEPEILDELGIIIRLDTVYKKFAEDIGKTSTQLTEFEKLTARTNAILGQTTDKFGDIAETVPANGFLQLSAAVFDLGRSGAALLSDVLEPLTKWLAESPILLGLLMAVITKNVLGKAFPALKSFGDKFAALPKKLGGSIDALNKRSESLGKRAKKLSEDLVRPKDLEKSLRNSLTKLKIKPNSALADALGKSITGKEFRDAIKKSISVAVGGANARITRTGAPGGMFGTDAGAVNVLREAFNKFDKSLNATNQSMRGLIGVEFLNFVNNTKSGFLHMSKGALGATARFMDFNKELFEIATIGGVNEDGTPFAASVIKAFKLIGTMSGDSRALMGGNLGDIRAEFQGVALGATSMSKAVGKSFLHMGAFVATGIGAATKAISGFITIVASKLIASLNYLTFAIGALSMLGMLGSWLLDLTDHLGKATKAADELGDSLTSVGARIEAASHINFDLMASNLTDAIKNSEFVSAVSEEISRSLEKAMSQIKIDAVVGEGIWFQLVDRAYDIFGMGLEDKLADALALTVKSMSDLKIGLPDSTFDKLSKLFKEGQGSTSTDEEDNVLEKVRLGIKLTTSDLAILQEELENSDNAKGLATVLELLTKAHTEHSKSITESDANLKSLRDTMQKYEKDRQKLVTGLVKGNIFEDLEKDFRALINLLDSTNSGASKVLNLEAAGVLPADNKDVDDYLLKLEALRAAEAFLAEARKSQEPEPVKKAALASVKTLLSLVETTGNNLFSSLKGDKSTEGFLAELFGQNPKDANAEAILLAGSIDAIQESISDYRKLGNVALKKQGTLEAEILRLQRGQLGTKLNFTKEGKLTAEQYQSITDQIELLTEKAHKASRNFGKISEYTHEINDDVYTLTERLADKRLDILGAGFEPDTKAKWDLQEMVDLDAIDQVTKAMNVFNHSLDDTFASAQKVTEVMSVINEGGTVSKDNLRKKFKNAFPTEKSFKNIAKWVKLAVTTQGKGITDRMEVLNKEAASRDLTLDNWGKHEDLLAYRERIAELERNYSEQGLKNEYEKLKLKETQAAISVMEASLVVEEWANLTADLAAAIQGTADGFSEGVSAFVSSKILDRDESGDDTWYVALGKTLSTGLATGVGDLVGNFAQQQVFGNKGLLSGAVSGMFSDKLADTLFPKTKTEKLREALTDLKKEADKRLKALSAIEVNTSKNSLIEKNTAAISTDTSVIKTKEFGGNTITETNTHNYDINLEKVGAQISAAVSDALVLDVPPVLTAASTAIVNAATGIDSSFKVQVVNFSEMPATAKAEDPSVQSARIYTDVVIPLSKSLDEISTALKSHSEGSTISKASIEELRKAVSASVPSIPGKPLVDPYVGNQVPEALKDAATAVETAFEDLNHMDRGNFKIAKQDELPPAFLNLLKNIEIGLKGQEEAQMPGHTRANYKVTGFASKAEGEATLRKAFTESLAIPKDSILFKNADFFLQAAGKYVAFESGKGAKGQSLAGTTDGKSQYIFLDKPGQAMSAIVHEALHPLVDKLSKLGDMSDFSKHSNKDFISLMEESVQYKQTLGHLGKDDRTRNAERVFLSALTATYNSTEAIEELLVRGIGQNSRMPVGTKPSDWVPEHIQKAVPGVVAEMDRLTASMAEFNKSWLSYFKNQSQVEPAKATDPRPDGIISGQIHDGISPAVSKILGDIDRHIAQSQEFLDTIAVKTLDSIDTLISFEIAVPLEDAAANIGYFVDVLDTKITPIMSKLDPILERMPELITQMTITLREINDFFGVTSSPVTSSTFMGDDWKADFSATDKFESGNFKDMVVAAKGTTTAVDKLNATVFKDMASTKSMPGSKLYHTPGTTTRGVYLTEKEIKAMNDRGPSNFVKGTNPDWVSEKAKAAQALQAQRAAKDARWAEQRKAQLAQIKAERLNEISRSITHPEPKKPSLQDKVLGEKGSFERWMKGNTLHQQKGKYDNQIRGTSYDITKLLVTEIKQLTTALIAKPGIKGWLGALAPSPLADGTQTQIGGFLAPGEAGPKTAHQTSVEALLSGLLERTPMLELSNAALNASMLASNGKGGATKVDIVNPEAINTSITDLGIAEDAKSAGKEGVRQLITAGHIDAQGIAQSVAGSLATKAADKAVDSIWDWASVLFADGGIAAGGFKAFASGGIVNQPTLGLVGEGKYNEAIVPLPDGKSIPVIGATGTNENNVTVNVTVDGNGTAKSDTQSGMDGDKAKQLGYMVSQAVQQELVQQQRPGGLLSQY